MPYCLSTVLANEIWFVLGMLLCFLKVPERIRAINRSEQIKMLSSFVGAGLVFIVLSVLIMVADIDFYGLGFLMGLLACVSVVGICIAEEKQGRVMAWLSGYTMPIFLMHSIFAATLRSVLLKLGIMSAWIHIPAGIAVSIIGPVIAAIVMKKLRYPEFFLNPGKFVKIDKER